MPQHFECAIDGRGCALPACVAAPERAPVGRRRRRRGLLLLLVAATSLDLFCRSVAPTPVAPVAARVFYPRDRVKVTRTRSRSGAATTVEVWPTGLVVKLVEYPVKPKRRPEEKPIEREKPGPEGKSSVEEPVPPGK